MFHFRCPAPARGASVLAATLETDLSSSSSRRRLMAIVQPIESPGGGRRLRISSPATKEPIGEIAVTTADEVRAIVQRARAAQPAWEAKGFDERAKVMRRALKLLVQRMDAIMDVIIRETGRS